MSVKNQLKAGALAFVALFVVVAICTPIANAQNALGLPVSPRSGSSLVGEAIHRGALQLPLSLQGLSVQQNLTCSPLPCVLPNVQASNGTNIANEDPIVSNPRNPAQLLTGANDYSCSVSLQGFYASNDGGATWTRTCLPVIAGGFGDGNGGICGGEERLIHRGDE